MRARPPDESGYVVRCGVRVYYEVCGRGRPTVLLLPPWAIVDSRVWKMQVPFLARHFRVVTFDPRGNGRSDRPDGAAAYADIELVADALAVLDATGTDRAVCVGLSRGAGYALRLAAEHPERVSGAVFIGPAVSVRGAALARPGFDEPVDDPAGWQKYNADHWRRDLTDFTRFFFAETFPEPHSSKAIEDGVEWAAGTDAETLIATVRAPFLAAEPGGADPRPTAARLVERVRCPTLVIHGDDDRIVGPGRGAELAAALGSRLELVHGGGHVVPARHPVAVNVLLRDFVRSIEPPPPVTTPWLFARERRRRALWVCSPIGLGHVLRDLAIARALRERVPELQIEWLAQPPVTDVLTAAGETVHPASAELASESAHWESESGAHRLPAFAAFRRMDEILCANYMVFDEAARATPYDLWVGDEAWEVDHFLHENPERKAAPYAFLTDVVGFLPSSAAPDPREAELCADYNAELIEHRERFPYVRDRSLFLGGYAELPDAGFGPGLPGIRQWSQRWFTSVPYVVPFDPAAYRDPAALRRRLGYGTGHPLYVAAVGGTAVGRDLLGLTIEAFERVRRRQPTAQLLVVTGPRLHPAELPDVEGVTKVGYLPALFEHLAAADLAIVQGGLSTTMELVAARRPFVYFPLAGHWEQEHFVTHRLDHYGAGVRMDYATATPERLAEAMIAGPAIRPRYRPVRRGGADKAAGLLASLLLG